LVKKSHNTLLALSCTFLILRATTRSQVLKDKPLKIRKSQVVLPKGGSSYLLHPWRSSSKPKGSNGKMHFKPQNSSSCIIVWDGITNNLRGVRVGTHIIWQSLNYVLHLGTLSVKFEIYIHTSNDQFFVVLNSYLTYFFITLLLF